MNGTIAATTLNREDAERWVLVDVRTPREFAGAHIEGSLNLPLGDLNQHAPLLREQAEGKRIALVCRTGQRAERARSVLQEDTTSTLHVLAGGVVAWEGEGLPLLRGEGGMSLERQVRVASGSLVLLSVLLAWLVSPLWIGLAAFVGGGLVFAGLTDTCGMGMLMARMPWNTSC